MKFWMPSPNKFFQHLLSFISPRRFFMLLMSAILFFLLLFISAHPLQGAELEKVLRQAAETTPELRDEREQVKSLENDIAQLRAGAGWQIFTTASYRRGESQEIVFDEDDLDFNDDNDNNDNNNEEENSDNDAEANSNDENNGNENDNDENDSNNDNDNDDDEDEDDEIETELEVFEEMTLGLGVQREFLSGFSLEADMSYMDDDPIDTEDISDNAVFSLDLNYQLWPRVPTESARTLEELEEQRDLAKQEFERSREDFYIEMLEEYLEISALKREKELAEVRLEQAENRLKETRRQREIEEAGKLELKEMKLAFEQAKNSRNTLQRSLESARDNFKEMLGEAPEPAYDLDASIWNSLENNFAGPAKELIERENKGDELKERMLAASVDYARLENELEQIKQEKEWWQREQHPAVDMSAGSPDIEEREWEASLNVSYNIHDGGLSGLEEDEFEQDKESLRKDIGDLKFALNQELKAALDAVERSREEVHTADLEARSADLDYQQEKEAYDRGASGEMDVEEKELDRDEAKINLQEKEIELLLDQVNLVSSLEYLLLEEVLQVD